MAVLKCACAYCMVKPVCTGGAGAGAESSEPVSIVVSSSSSETLGELAGKPASMCLARRLCQVAARAATTCFISGDRLSHSAFSLAVMADAVQGRRMWRGWCCGMVLAGCGRLYIANSGEARRPVALMRAARVGFSVGGPV